MYIKPLILPILLGLLHIGPAGAEYIALPTSAFCKSSGAYNDGMFQPNWHNFRSPREGGPDSLSYLQGLKVREEYVKPALEAACAAVTSKSNGQEVILAGLGACEAGCKAVNDLSVAPKSERPKLEATCQSACDIGAATLLGYGLGVTMGPPRKR